MAALIFAVLTASCAPKDAVTRAQRLVRLNREAEALAGLRAHLTEHPDDVPARRLYVRVLALSGDLDGARGQVEELERRTPGDPTGQLELGRAYEIARRFDDALDAYDAAAKVAPTSPAGPREGGMRAARWGEAEAAIERLEEAVRRGARDAETFHVLGLARLHVRDLDGAEQAYRRGLAADPGATENLLGLATVALVRDDHGAALAAYDAIIAQRPRYAAAHLGRAFCLAKLGRRGEAERALDRASELGAPRANVDKQRRAIREGAL